MADSFFAAVADYYLAAAVVAAAGCFDCFAVAAVVVAVGSLPAETLAAAALAFDCRAAPVHCCDLSAARFVHADSDVLRVLCLYAFCCCVPGCEG